MKNLVKKKSAPLATFSNAKRRGRHYKRGLFITFEGMEGSGKTTQIKALAQWMMERGLRVLQTREPGGTPIADQIRSLLLDAKTRGLTPEMELFLYEVARRDHVKEVIQPALKKGTIVLCDRFGDSTTAYQGYARGLSIKDIENMNIIASGGLQPDITFLFDLPTKEGLSRARKRKRGLDRLERESLLFHDKVRKGYLTLARKEKKRFKIIHANRSPTIIFAKLRKELDRKMEKLL